MNIIVVDASVASKWLVSEERSDAARHLLTGPSELHAPDLIISEVGNVLWKRWRRGELDAAETQALLADWRVAPLTLHGARPLLETAWRIARDAERTLYDSLYVALAEHLGCSLVTADERFARALAGTAWGSMVVTLA